MSESTETPVDAEVVQSRALTTLMENPPAVVLKEAAIAAAALKDVLNQKPKKVMMNGEQYLEFEDWQTLARFYGYTVGSEGEPEFVQYGDVQGFKAHAMVLDHNQNIISRAHAYCLSDEEKWGSRTKYAWVYVLKDGSTSIEDPGPSNIEWVPNPRNPGKKMPLKERRVIGTEKVPLYQLASMAQTRASAKALRNVLSWVAVLAGYRPTPAEEIGVHTEPNSPKEPPKPPHEQPPDDERPPTKAEPTGSDQSEQRTEFWKSIVSAENMSELQSAWKAACDAGFSKDTGLAAAKDHMKKKLAAPQNFDPNVAEMHENALRAAVIGRATFEAVWDSIHDPYKKVLQPLYEELKGQVA